MNFAFALKKFTHRIPALASLYYKFRGRHIAQKRPDEIFREIYESNLWGSGNSASGKGSELTQTTTLSMILPDLFEELSIKSLLDIPCGDFHWMKDVDLKDVNYIGGDIVDELVEKNQKTYTKKNIAFSRLDLLADKLPKADMIFCRDCMVHLSNDDVYKALKRITASNSGYLFATTFTSRPSNYDIVTGQWRPLNLQRPPFNLPTPLRIINEGCTQDNGQYQDKSLALWSIESIREIVNVN